MRPLIFILNGESNKLNQIINKNIKSKRDTSHFLKNDQSNFEVPLHNPSLCFLWIHF